MRLIRTKLDGGPIRYATLSSDGSFMVASGGGGASIWQTAWLGDQPRVRFTETLDGHVTAAAGAGSLVRTILLVLDRDGGVSQWRAVTPDFAARLGGLTGHADVVGVSNDGLTGVTIDESRATLWETGGWRPEARATLTFDRPVTTVAFAPAAELVLAAGHADGGVTVHTVDVDTNTATKRALTSDGGPVDTVALSADASTVLAVHHGGLASVWKLTTETDEPTGQIQAGGKGPYRAWLSPAGWYAFIAASTGTPALWSLVSPVEPVQVGTFEVGADPAVPAMISADGRRVAAIDRTDTLTIWDAGPVIDLLASPVARACQIAELDEPQWRAMVPDPTYRNPCAEPPPPTIGTY
jgi:WD40 repeat protein